MRQAVYGILLIYLLMVVAHLLLIPVNQKMHQRIKAVSEEKREIKMENLKPLRIELERKGKHELKSYRWVDQRKGYAEIPIDRAFDYYLLHPNP